MPAASYILMPERLSRNNNTIGSVLIPANLSHRYEFVKLSLTVKRHPHISAAPETNGAAGTAPDTEADGSKDPPVHRSPEGLDPRVVRSMHCLIGKGYAGGGEHSASA